MTGKTPEKRTPSGRAGRSRRVTLADVAERAGVSKGAASFTLTGRTDQRISEETQQRVRAAAEELGYRPNVTAKILRTGRSGTIAIVSEYVTSTPYATEIIAGALDTALKNDILLFIAESLGDIDLEKRLLHNMLDRRVDGFIYSAMFTHQVNVPDVLHDVPLVLLNCTSDDVDAPIVIPDDESAGRTAVGALLEAGHRDSIHYLGAPPANFSGGALWGGRIGTAVSDRLNGVRAELKRAHLTLASEEPLLEWEPENGRTATAALLSRGKAPKAIICANDRIAFGAYQALADATLRVPTDVSIISFDDSDLARWLQPGLSSLALPHAEMGRKAVELLLAGKSRHDRHILPMPLHQRGSIAPPNTKRR